MSEGIVGLHSHSELERILCMSKRKVICDARFKDMFVSSGYAIETFKYKGVEYCIVPTILFVSKGGIFKNLSQ